MRNTTPRLPVDKESVRRRDLEAFMLRLQGQSYEQIATTLGVHESNVCRGIHRECRRRGLQLVRSVRPLPVVAEAIAG